MGFKKRGKWAREIKAFWKMSKGVFMLHHFKSIIKAHGLWIGYWTGVSAYKNAINNKVNFPTGCQNCTLWLLCIYQGRQTSIQWLSRK